MAAPIKEPTTEEYMDIIERAAEDEMQVFLDESFGTGPDYDDDRAVAFAKELMPHVEEYLKTKLDESMTMENMDTPEVAVEATAVEAKTETKVEVAQEAKADAVTADEVKAPEGEATPAS